MTAPKVFGRMITRQPSIYARRGANAALLYLGLATTFGGDSAKLPTYTNGHAIAEQHKHSLVLVYAKDGPAAAKRRAQLRRVASDLTGDVVAYELQAKHRKSAPWLRRWAVGSFLPAVVLLAPNGCSICMFPNDVDTDWVRRSLVSPAQAAVLKAKDDGKPAILVVGHRRLPQWAATLSAAQEFAKQTGNVVPVVEVSPAEAKDRPFLRSLNVSLPLAKSMVVVVASGMAQERMTGPASAAAISSAIARSMRGACPCLRRRPRTPGPELP